MRLIGHMALVALIIGTSVAAAATERLTLPLVLGSAMAWSFIPVIQALTGLWLVRGAAPGQHVRALERYFETHRPWSLWILAAHAMFLWWPALREMALLVVPTGVLPAVLTIRALRMVCRDVIGMPPPAARRAVATHQAITYVIIAAYACWASAYLPRLVRVLS